MRIAGIDVSRGSITIVVLSETPDDLRRSKHKPFKLKANREGIEQLLALEFDCAILEPSGMHYSKIWVHHLRKAGREVRWVDHLEIANYRKSWKVANKTDQLDAIALACYGLERYDRPSHFIRAEGEKLRELLFQLKHLNRSKNPPINRLRQQLCSEFPEVAEREVKRPWICPNPPGLLQFIAGELDSKKWQQEYSQTIGTGLGNFSRGLARQLCGSERLECEIELELEQELSRPEYASYIKVFKNYAFGPRTNAAILSAIYPFDQFLKDGRQISEYLVNDDGKRSRRNRSLAAFKLRCGMGMTYYQSGDSSGWKAGGSSDTRKSLWQWVKVAIVMKPNLNLPQIAALRSYYDNGSRQTVEGEEKLFSPGVRNQKVMRVTRRAIERLYRDLRDELKV